MFNSNVSYHICWVPPTYIYRWRCNRGPVKIMCSQCNKICFFCCCCFVDTLPFSPHFKISHKGNGLPCVLSLFLVVSKCIWRHASGTSFTFEAFTYQVKCLVNTLHKATKAQENWSMQAAKVQRLKQFLFPLLPKVRKDWGRVTEVQLWMVLQGAAARLATPSSCQTARATFYPLTLPWS